MKGSLTAAFLLSGTAYFTAEAIRVTIWLGLWWWG